MSVCGGGGGGGIPTESAESGGRVIASNITTSQNNARSQMFGCVCGCGWVCVVCVMCVCDGGSCMYVSVMWGGGYLLSGFIPFCFNLVCNTSS